ncbi:MAG: hypothetical protein QF828_03590 [Pseudomonadales bacterium]|nr:hypothetical protein [Pseudomonadales bacterium]
MAMTTIWVWNLTILDGLPSTTAVLREIMNCSKKPMNREDTDWQ